MTVFYSAINESYLGYSAIFVCVAAGFFFLRGMDSGESGPGLWAMSFLLNAAGFLFWSGALPLPRVLYFLVGEILHIAGFFCLAYGAFRFCGYRGNKWIAALVLLWIVIWATSITMIGRYPAFANIALKGLRTLLFAAAGILVLLKRSDHGVAGQRIAGFSLIAWGVYLFAFAFIGLRTLLELAFGFLVGFQILGAFGLQTMVVDRIRHRAAESERRVKKLEGLLPICSYCKKIRDGSKTWHTLEAYIEDHSKAEFSHGICPDCFQKHRPDRD